MDLSFLDKSSDVTPYLVRLYDSQKIYNLAKEKQPLAKVELTSIITDLLHMNLSVRESELIADVLIALMRQAELDLRQVLAEKLSVMDTVPLRLVLQMANDEISVAAPVLRNSPILGDVDLLYIIKSRPADYWREIAARHTLNAQVINVLAETRDMETALVLAENENITLTEQALDILGDMACGEEKLATPLLRRSDVPKDLARMLYNHVSVELKQFILKNYDVDQSGISEALDDAVLELQDSSETKEFMPNASMLEAADRFKDKGLLTVNLLLGTLKRGQIQSFIAQFARFANMEPLTALEIFMQPTAQGLAVACKAFGITKPDFINIYLLTNRLRSGEKVVDMKDMSKAIQYYERMDRRLAEDIMKQSGRLPG